MHEYSLLPVFPSPKQEARGNIRWKIQRLFLSEATKFGASGRHSDSISPCPYQDDASVFQFYICADVVSSSPIKGLAATIFYLLPHAVEVSRFLAHHNVQLVCLEYPLPQCVYISQSAHGLYSVLDCSRASRWWCVVLHLLGWWPVGWWKVYSEVVIFLAHSVSLLSRAETIVRFWQSVPSSFGGLI